MRNACGTVVQCAPLWHAPVAQCILARFCEQFVAWFRNALLITPLCDATFDTVMWRGYFQ